MNKILRAPLQALDKITSVRPLTFFTIGGIVTAFDKHFPTWGDKIEHVVICIAGGAFIEWIAIAMAADIKRKRRKLLEKTSEAPPRDLP